MPNWCVNNIEISHKDPEMMERVRKSLFEDKFLQEFFPCPSELYENVPVGENYVERSEAKENSNREKFGYSDWYGWCIDNWGTKWDVSDSQFEYDPETNSGSGYFMSAWGPPISAMEKLTELGFNVTLKYFEPGMCFVGQYTSEDGDEYYEYNFDDEDWRDDIPSDLIDCFGLESDYESHLEYMKEMEEDEETEDQNEEKPEKEDDGS
jgi:hypothetical protein